jgi:hypothetical protein
VTVLCFTIWVIVIFDIEYLVKMCELKNPPIFTWDDCKVYHYKTETMLKGWVTYGVVSKITFNDLLTLGNTYTTLNDSLNQIIPLYTLQSSHVNIGGFLSSHILTKYSMSKMTITHIVKHNTVTDDIRDNPINNYVCHRVSVI